VCRVEAKIVLSSRRKELLVHNNYTYRKCKTLNSGEVYWRCSVEKSCRAKIFTVGAENIISRFEERHDHGSDEKKNKQEITE
jgi:hypothetical protein